MKELTVEAIVEQIETVTEFVNAELEKLDCPMKARIQLDIAIDDFDDHFLSIHSLIRG